MHKIAALWVGLVGALSLCNPGFSSDATSTLRGRLFAQYRTLDSIRCASQLAQVQLTTLPFKVVIAVASTKSSPTSRRNFGAHLLYRMLWSLTPYEYSSAGFGAPIDWKEGLELYTVLPDGKHPLREHLIFAKFAQEAPIESLMRELVRELKLNSREDILVIHPDLEIAPRSKIEIKRAASDNGNDGTRALAYATGMWSMQWHPEHGRQVPHYPFSILRVGLGNPARDRSQNRRAVVEAYLNTPPDDALIDWCLPESISLVQRWLVTGYYLRHLPSRTREQSTDPSTTYFGLDGPPSVGLR